MIVVQGTVTANPLTEFVEPTSPVTGTSLVAGTQATVQVGPYKNNSNVSLQITGATVSSPVNCTATISPSAFPFTIPAGGTGNLGFSVTPAASGSYSFDVAVTVTT